MSLLHRRNSLSGAASLLSAAALLPRRSEAAAEDFSFLFLTDTHLEPELKAAQGCAQCFQKARTLGCDFAIQGGDHIFDSLGVPKTRAESLWGLYDKTEQDLGLKLHHTIGNHDCFGVYPTSGASPSDPDYGKKMFQERFGQTYYSFDHKGVHFLVLDSIGITADRAYEGRIDAAQLAWLKADLNKLEPRAPAIVVTHIPLVTAFNSYLPWNGDAHKRDGLTVANADEVVPLFAGRHVLAVLQGHTHINETVLWQGVPYITSGAVCGNWWKGVRMGTPEGFTVVTVKQGQLSTRYETYGFQAVTS